jgi:hypothetical protein
MKKEIDMKISISFFLVYRAHGFSIVDEFLSTIALHVATCKASMILRLTQELSTFVMEWTISDDVCVDRLNGFHTFIIWDGFITTSPFIQILHINYICIKIINMQKGLHAPSYYINLRYDNTL